MKCLLKRVNIIAPGAPHDGKLLDILIDENGTISDIGPEIKSQVDQRFDFEGACVSAGFIDIGVHACDPGFEHKEDLNSVANAAASGGFTAIAVLPNTYPTLHSKSEVLYIQNNSRHLLPDIYPIGAISQNCEGKDITEMLDMHHAGAIAFSDGLHPVQNGGLMMRSLQYVKAFDGLIMNQGLDQSISNHGQINEGAISTSLGMKGIPALAEEMMIQRDIQLARYTASRIHISNLSTAGSVELVRQAKAEGLRITASVPVLNLLLSDDELLSFDTNLKVNPPLRTSADIAALKQGLKDGTIDFLTSNHIPVEREEKLVEFTYADFGIINLQTAFSISVSALKESLSLPEIVHKWTAGVRQVFKIPDPVIEIGAKANLCVFAPDTEWVFSRDQNQSKSSNTPFFDQPFRGKILAVFNRNRSMVFSSQ